ncbi:AP2/B3-like transcriptional factor family protein [Striga asiatica]|uniref:AP2/B3-like transcriptional factor family protein n=1 Tax=Striga asiatica TaxID=4170 RepID=A0A5A7Q881_STRAF|nr:AP2/B3-like transcriptional factor family protein [Striga asiatica]GER41182.1 AP2/B3-like transcriptional factor family protein [Striga asiatica]
MTREAYCLSKTLTSVEVVRKKPRLYFDPYDASVLADCPNIGRHPLMKCSKKLSVYDGENRRFLFNLRDCTSGGVIRSYCIDNDWKIFLRKHNLREGDVLTFYRFREAGVFKLKYYYVLKYFRKPLDVVDRLKSNEDRMEKIFDGQKRIVLGPDSSASCFYKTLTSIEVVQKNPKLYFDPHDASVLTNCPEIGRRPLGQCSKWLSIFDGKNRKYKMNLQHCISGGEIRSFCISMGWKKFLRAHNLREGDVLTFYRFRVECGDSELRYYYVLKYFRKPPDVDRYKNEVGQEDE